MGCNISTQPRVTPQRPAIKVDRLKSIQSPTSPTSASKTTANSPHHDPVPRPASSGNSNPASQNWSGVTFGALDVAKEDYSWRNMRSPSIGMRLSCNGDLTKRRDSPDPSPLLEGPHQPFYELIPVITFSSDPVVVRRSERFLTVGKKSEFFNEMMSNNSKGLLKLNTCSEALQVGLSNEKLEVDEKTFPKSMDDIQTCTNLLVVTEQEIRPGTPGFKPASSHMSSHVALAEGEEEDSRDSRPSPQPQETGTLQVRQENSREIKSVGHSPSNQLSLHKDKEHQEKTSVHKPEKRVGENNKVQLGKMFTQNLLDLVSPKKPKATPTTTTKALKKTESNATAPEKAKRQSTHEFGDDLSLSLISNIQAAFDVKKGSGEVQVTTKQRNKVGPLGLNNIGFCGNDEMISPINNKARQDNSGYVTPPFLNQTSFMKHIFGEGEGEGHGEKIGTNNENFSRAEFEKYSFLADEQIASYNEISLRPTKKPSSSSKPVKTSIAIHNE